MTAYQFTVVIEPGEAGYHAYAPVLPGCHSFGDTTDGAKTNILVAIEFHIERMVEDGELIPVEREPTLIT